MTRKPIKHAKPRQKFKKECLKKLKYLKNIQTKKPLNRRGVGRLLYGG
jgi:hypothetical protein